MILNISFFANLDFRIVNPFELEDTKPNNGISQLIDDEITFNLDGNSQLETEVELEPRRSPNGYILPDPLPAGLIVTDLKKGRWKIGNSVGLGGFGEIYSAASWNGCQKSAQEKYVIKVVCEEFGLFASKIDTIKSID